jgi:hypothetical protein
MKYIGRAASSACVAAIKFGSWLSEGGASSAAKWHTNDEIVSRKSILRATPE